MSGAGGLLLVWIVLAGLSAAYVAFDAFTRNPELTVMKWGWVLVTVYTGVIGLALYLLTCREPAPGTHAAFVAPLWRQAFGSMIHCLAGDATGIIAAATVTSALAFSMWPSVLVEYVAGVCFGLLIFQSLFMRDMAGGSYAGAVRRSFLPEFLSMNCVMAGMIPVMVILSDTPAARDPSSPAFWGVMSLAVIVGGAVAYPINVWLVAKHMKHGMGTVRVFGHGGAPSGAPDGSTDGGTPGMDGMDGDAMSGMAGMAGMGPGTAMASTATHQEVVGMTILSLVALAAGIVVAAVFGAPLV